jgi:type I restriction enzyme S subunit
VLLPKETFDYTTFSTCILFFVKGEKTKNVEFREIKIKDQIYDGIKSKYIVSDEILGVVNIDKIREKNYSLKYDDYFKVKEEKKSGWIKLGDVCEIKSGKRLPKDQNFTKNRTKHPYIKVGDIDNISLSDNYLDKMSYISEETYDLIKNYIVHSGDLIMSSVGSVGKMLIIPEYLNGANLTENCVKLTIKNRIIDKNYLFYYLKLIYYDIIKIGSQGNCQPKLGIFQINDFQIPNLPLEHQTEIVEFLDEVYQDSSLEDTVKYMKDYPIFNLLINKDYDGFREILWYQKNIQFVMEEIVNVKRKKNNHIRSLFNTVKNKCKMIKLGMIVEIKFGTRITKSKDEKSKDLPNVYPVYGGGDITFYTDKFNRDGETVILSRFGVSPKCVRVINGKLFLNDSGMSIHNRSNNLMDFIKFYLLYHQQHIYENYTAGQAQLNTETNKLLREFEIPIPPLQIQEQIINKINQLNDHTSHYEQYAKTLQTELELMNETISNLTLYSEEIKLDNPIETIRNNDIYDDTDKLIKSLNTKNIKIKKVECEVMDV